jgi:hypothetical protein
MHQQRQKLIYGGHARLHVSRRARRLGIILFILLCVVLFSAVVTAKLSPYPSSVIEQQANPIGLSLDW